MALLYRFRKQIPYYLDFVVSPFICEHTSWVITGFWRSGTTWLQKYVAKQLGAKTIFEPLSLEAYRAYQIDLPSHTTPPELYSRAYMPFYQGTIPAETGLYQLISDALRGRIRGKRVRIARDHWRESLHRRIVVKFVRAHLCICAIQQTFKNPVIHIYRDPRSVIASINRDDWGGEWLHNLSLPDQLLKPGDGRSAFFSEWTDDIYRSSEKDWLFRVALYWMLSERYVQSRLQHFHLNAYMVQYESLLAEDQRELSLLSNMLGITHNQSLDGSFYASSPTTAADRRNASVNSRFFSWKQELDPKTINDIENLAAQFNFLPRLITHHP